MSEGTNDKPLKSTSYLSLKVPKKGSESYKLFQRLHSEFLANLLPVGPIEQHLVEQISVAAWSQTELASISVNEVVQVQEAAHQKGWAEVHGTRGIRQQIERVLSGPANQPIPTGFAQEIIDAAAQWAGVDSPEESEDSQEEAQQWTTDTLKAALGDLAKSSGLPADLLPTAIKGGFQAKAKHAFTTMDAQKRSAALSREGQLDGRLRLAERLAHQFDRLLGQLYLVQDRRKRSERPATSDRGGVFDLVEGRRKVGTV